MVVDSIRRRSPPAPAILACKDCVCARARSMHGGTFPANPAKVRAFKSPCRWKIPPRPRNLDAMTYKPKSDAKIRIMLVEDHILMRLGLVSATRIEPDMVVVAEAEDG